MTKRKFPAVHPGVLAEDFLKGMNIRARWPEGRTPVSVLIRSPGRRAAARIAGSPARAPDAGTLIN